MGKRDAERMALLIPSIILCALVPLQGRESGQR